MSAPAFSRRAVLGGVGVLALGAGVGVAALWERRRATTSAVADGRRASGVLAKPVELGQAMGSDFWARQFAQLDGGTIALSKYQSQPLLINFWATWCPPCVEELPMIDAFFANQGPDRFEALALAVDKPASVQKFLAQHVLRVPVAIAQADALDWIRQLGNSSGGLPFTIVIDRLGRLAGRKIGALDEAQLQTWKRELVHV